MSTKQKPWFLSKEKKERSNFWKSRSSGYSSSNYWLKDSIFDKRDSAFFDDDPTLEKESKYDHMQLAQYQRAISNFVRILTGRGDIVVRYSDGGNSYTDGKTITLSPNIKEKEFDTAVGLALHEASHILYTDFDKLKKYMEKAANESGSRYSKEVEQRKVLLNIVEDLYIDAMTYRSAPGYRGYYSSLYQKYFGDKKIVEGLWSRDFAEPIWDNYLFHVCNIRNPQRNLQALPALDEIFNLLDLPNITRLSTFKDRLTVSKKIYEIITKYVDAAKELEEELKKQMGSGTADGEGEGSNGDGSGENSEEMTQTLNDMLEQMADREAAGQDAGDEEGAGTEAGSGDKFTASNGIRIQEEMEETNALDLDKLSDKAKKQLEKIINNQREFIKGITRKGRLSKADQNKVDAWAEVDMEKKIVGANSEFSTKGIPLYIIDNITPGFIDSVGSNYGLRSYIGNYNSRNIEEGINRGKMLAKKLQLRNEERVLKTSRLDSGKIDKRLLHEIGFDNFDIFSKVNINAYKPSYIHISIDQSGSMENGRKFQDAMQFAAMFATASKYINNIHLVISVRSSTSEGRGHWGSRSEEKPYLMYIFDSKKNNIQHIRNVFPKVQPYGFTPEGLCFDGIMNDTIKKAANTDAYFINICDGEPYLQYGNTNGHFDYKGDKAKQHSKKQMQRMIQNGINFITYFIGSEYDFEAVEKCYGKNAVHLQRADEIVKIANTMNKKLLAA
jgi:hypothetical protein